MIISHHLMYYQTSLVWYNQTPTDAQKHYIDTERQEYMALFNERRLQTFWEVQFYLSLEIMTQKRIKG